VRTTLLHAREARAVVPAGPPVELALAGTVSAPPPAASLR